MKSLKSHTERPEDVSEGVWCDFLALRKAHKAPVTETALKAIAKQAGLAKLTLEEALTECCARGWRGFRAEWLGNRAGAKPAMSFDEQKRQADIRRWEEMTGRVHPENANITQGVATWVEQA